MKVSVFDRPRIPLFDCSSDAARRLLRSLIGAVVLAVAFSLFMSAIGRDVAQGASPQRAILRAEVAIPDAIVTIGDFFADAGEKASVPLFRSPDLGTTGSVPARRVVDLARAAGLVDAEAGGLVEVRVTRLARSVEADDFARLIATEALRRNTRTLAETTIDDLRVAFDAAVEPRRADLRAAEPARLVSFSHNPQNGRFEALFLISRGDGDERLNLRGEVVETVRVVTLTRAFARGEIVTADDLAIDRQPRRQSTGLKPVEPEQIVGMAARRALRAGQAVTPGDFSRPLVVTRGESVTVVYETASLTITSRGQALGSGAVGDLVDVLNPQSKRTVHATVAGPGRVVVIAAPKTVAAIGRNTP
ncbi:MAG: flagellar basal body P-ring formation chaperone FlgA [Siculibacillus sp.]|nr:flagellar basal body P-ring formation chaperone FlgA [Siculibacillus sp.]